MVPKCLSKNFTYEDGFLHEYLIEKHRFVRRVPKKMFYETDLYNQIDEDGLVNDVFERQISKWSPKLRLS